MTKKDKTIVEKIGIELARLSTGLDKKAEDLDTARTKLNRYEDFLTAGMFFVVEAERVATLKRQRDYVTSVAQRLNDAAVDFSRLGKQLCNLAVTLHTTGRVEKDTET